MICDCSTPTPRLDTRSDSLDCVECGGTIPRKPLGRPPIPAEQRLKQRAARWTDSAWEACERKAQAAGMSTAAWIRKVTEEAESV